MEWNNDAELFDLITTELYTAVIGDICDELGLRRQFLSPDIRPLKNAAISGLMTGRAMTVLEVNVFSELESLGPFGKMLEAIDDLKGGEIYICAGANSNYATIGEIMAAALMVNGARGAVTDSRIRDQRGILEVGIPVYSLGGYAQDQRGRGVVLDYRVPIEINGVNIHDQDLIVGDDDGVIVVPKEHEPEVIEKALAKARGEKTVKQAILGGMSATEAFSRYGIM